MSPSPAATSPTWLASIIATSASTLPCTVADSTNIARNVGIDKRWKTGAYPPPTKEARARLMRTRIEHFQAAERWDSEL